MTNYNPFEPEEDFNPLNQNDKYNFDSFNMGSKELLSDIGLTNQYSSQIILNLRKQKPK